MQGRRCPNRPVPSARPAVDGPSRIRPDSETVPSYRKLEKSALYDDHDCSPAARLDAHVHRAAGTCVIRYRNFGFQARITPDSFPFAGRRGCRVCHHDVMHAYVVHIATSCSRCRHVTYPVWQNSTTARGTVCHAQAPAQSRREALALGLAAAASLIVPGAALANSGAPKNASAASMSSFTMEGTKKQGVSPKRKAKVLNKLKEKIAAGELS
jgi:hypothetical protein